MRRHTRIWQLGVCVLGTYLCFEAVAADVYRSQNPDGTFRYSSQALDSTYELYLRGNSATEVGNRDGKSVLRSAGQTALEPLIDRFSRKHAVDPALVRAVINIESRFDAHSVSPKGAVGAMQLMPATAARYGVTQRTDPAQNIEAGIRYLKDLLRRHDGNVALALAAYNAGVGAVARHGRRIPPYKETMLYVPAVMSRLEAARNTTR